ncbi:hypothetical protein [Spirosoma aerophilum]
MNLKLNIEKELTGYIGKELACPDGEKRTLKTFELGGNGITTLHWGGGQFKEIPTGNFWNEWPAYLPERHPDAPVAPTELAKVSLTPQTQNAEMQAQAVINTNDVVALLREQMLRVKSSANAIPQAKTMGDLAKQIIEAEKLKLETIKVIHSINNQK